MNLAARMAAIAAENDDDKKQSLRLFTCLTDIIVNASALELLAADVRKSGPLDREALARRLDGLHQLSMQAIGDIIALYGGEDPPPPPSIQ